MEDDLNFFVKNKNDVLPKNGRQPKKKNLFSIPLKFKIRNGRRPPKKMEDDLKKIKWKTTKKKKKKGRRPKKRKKEDEQKIVFGHVNFYPIKDLHNYFELIFFFIDFFYSY